MTSEQMKARRCELGLTPAELAYALQIDLEDVLRVESGTSDPGVRRRFEEAFDEFESRVLATFVGA